VLNGLSFTVAAGQKLGLMGANGVGKSTLLKIIVGELEPDKGE
jgi:ABC-type multidrug transport system ATPase subunit